MQRKSKNQHDDSSFLERINRHPEIKARVEEILQIAEAKGEVCTADEIEAMLINSIRQLGSRAMTDWANQAHQRTVEEMEAKKPAVYRNKKKR